MIATDCQIKLAEGSTTSGGFAPVWSPDGRRLFFLAIQPARLMVAEVETDPTFSRSTPTQAVRLTFPVIRGGRRFDLAPDGERFIVRTPSGGSQAAGDTPFIGLIIIENWFEELKELVPVP